MTYLTAPITDYGVGFFTGLSLGVLFGAFLTLAALAMVRAAIGEGE